MPEVDSGKMRYLKRLIEDAAVDVLSEEEMDERGLQRLIDKGSDFQKDFMRLIRSYARSPFTIPTYDDLCKEFDAVGEEFKSYKVDDWQLDDSCKGVALCDLESAKLITFGKYVSAKSALIEMKSSNLRPSSFDEFLAYLRRFPDRQNNFSIICLGVSCFSFEKNDGHSYWPSFLPLNVNGRRMLYLERGLDWHGNCQFLTFPV